MLTCYNTIQKRNGRKAAFPNTSKEAPCMKMKDFGFYCGVNLGGWLSQCDYSEERLNGFITKKDIAVIAGWGLDHVRIPVDYNVVQREDGSVREDGFLRIERALKWCREYGLNAVIDLHKTAGFSFDKGEKEAGFFENPAYQARFYGLWEEMARRFGADSGHVAFELLNEVTEQRFISAWNLIAAQCIRRIRALAPQTLILVGSYHNNSAAAVEALDAPADGRVVYNFHCYDPLPFTHQGAHWVDWLDQKARVSFEEAALPADYFDRQFSPALRAAQKHGAMLYCGEYGVIDQAKPEDAVKWFRQIHDTFEKYGISRCAWSYKQMDFGLSDERLDGVREELLKLL